MGYFLTAKSRMEQTNTNGYWKLVDNELYMNNKGEITITPRYFWTDGYTVPLILVPFLGDKNSYDVRPAHAHDLFCRFHERIVVNLSLTQLKIKGYLRLHNDMLVCDDIPQEYLKIDTISKTKADNYLKEMMESCKINQKTCNIFRIGVFFNLNWNKTGKKHITEYDIYNEDIGLVNGL